MGARRRCLVGLVLGIAAQPTHAAAQDSWDDASTVVRNGLVVAALGAPLAKKDTTGALQAAGSMGAAFAVTAVTKETLPEWRPDRSDRRSFPSGHVSVSFAAAATLQKRYGWGFGVPAHLAAAFVGLARVEAKKHDWADVAVGALVGEASGLLLTRTGNGKAVVAPYATTTGAGVVAAFRF